MQVNSLQNIVSTNTFKDFHITANNHAAMMKNENLPIDTHLSHHKEEKSSPLKKAIPLIGAIAGTVLPLVIFNKVQNKTINKDVLKSGKFLDKLKEVGEYFEIDGVPKILSTAAGGIAGGLLGGCVVDKNKEDRKEKVKEALFEITNIAVPTFFVAGAVKFMQSKKLDKGIGKFAPVVFGLGLGIPTAQKISNTISKKVFKDKGEERKFKPTDLLVHSDDLIEMLVLMKVPFAKKLHIDKILALIYAKCGYETGTKDAHNKSTGHHHH